MLPEARIYRDQKDLERMLALLRTGRAAGIPAYYVHAGALLWWLYYPPLGSAFWQTIFLWDDAQGGLLGWALLAGDGSTFDVYYRPDFHASEMALEMFAWAEAASARLARQAGSSTAAMFWVTPEDRFRAGWLEKRGFTFAGQDAALERLLDEPLAAYRVAHGFTIRACRGLDEVEARARAQYGAFQSSAPFDAYLQRFTRFMQSPAYQPERDLVAAAPDGQPETSLVLLRVIIPG